SGPVALTSLDEVAQADFFEISSRGCRVCQDGYHRFGVRAPRKSAIRRPPPARRACRKYAASTILPAGVAWLRLGLRRFRSACRCDVADANAADEQRPRSEELHVR